MYPLDLPLHLIVLPSPTSNCICTCNPLPFIPPPLSIALQNAGFTALLLASNDGHTEAINALLTAPDINVNHTDVSLYRLTPSHIILAKILFL